MKEKTYISEKLGVCSSSEKLIPHNSVLYNTHSKLTNYCFRVFVTGKGIENFHRLVRQPLDVSEALS